MSRHLRTVGSDTLSSPATWATLSPASSRCLIDGMVGMPIIPSIRPPWSNYRSNDQDRPGSGDGRRLCLIRNFWRETRNFYPMISLEIKLSKTGSTPGGRPPEGDPRRDPEGEGGGPRGGSRRSGAEVRVPFRADIDADAGRITHEASFVACGRQPPFSSMETIIA